jgi:hypothetical protein
MASAAGPRRTAQKLQSGVKPAHVAASNVSPVSHRGAKQKARAAIAQVAEKAPALDTGRFERGRYALAYLASMSPQHPVPPPANPADAAKLAHTQADMLVGVIRPSSMASDSRTRTGSAAARSPRRNSELAPGRDGSRYEHAAAPLLRPTL